MRFATGTAQRWNVDFDPDTEAIVTIGSKEGIAHLVLATLGRGDTVLVPNPSYPIHIYGPIIAGADVRSVPMTTEGEFLAEVERTIRLSIPKPKMLILNFPSNPTAQCVELPFFEKIVALAREHGIWIVHDLAYADICFDGWKAPSIMQVPGARDVAVEFFTMSKSYNMAGWRVGFMVGNRDLVNALARIKGYHDYGTFTPIQVATIAALEGPQDCVHEIAATYERRRDVLVKGLRRGRLAGGEAQGVDVRMGADSRALPCDGIARVRQASAGRGEGVGVAGHRLRRVRRRPRALRDDRERGAHAPGHPRHQADVPQRHRARFSARRAERSARSARGVAERRPAGGHRGRRDDRRRRPRTRRDEAGIAAPLKPLNVGLLGFGTVGRGTFDVLARNAGEIARRAGRPIEVSAIATRSPDRARATAAAASPPHVSTDLKALVRRRDVDIVCELIGGIEPARELILDAIAHGKHVVTANKALLAHHGTEIFAAAHAKGVMVAFEAAVAGGVPIIKALREGLSANRIEWIAGIINGTSNFILSEMRARGATFAEVLAEAQARGFAEADPTFDVDGIDAAHKLTIMSAIAFGIPMQFDSAYAEGIRALAGEDIRYAEELGYRIKLLGITRRVRHGDGEGVELRVHPTLIPRRQLIANVEGAMNAVLVKGDAVGATLYYGAGAGAEPTASAIIADLVDVTRMHTADPHHRVPHLAFQPDQLTDLPILPIGEVRTSYYLRMRVDDRPGVLADITRILADRDISIDAMIQKEPSEGEDQTDIILLTHETLEKRVVDAIARIESLATVRGSVVRLRLESLA